MVPIDYNRWVINMTKFKNVYLWLTVEYTNYLYFDHSTRYN